MELGGRRALRCWAPPEESWCGTCRGASPLLSTFVPCPQPHNRRSAMAVLANHTMQSRWKSPSVCHFPNVSLMRRWGKGEEKKRRETWRKHPLAHSHPCTLSQAACGSMHNRVVLSEAPNAKSWSCLVQYEKFLLLFCNPVAKFSSVNFVTQLQT